jgi:CHAT domain-containing protein/Tfp pilus assembly protein PilF
MTLRALVLAVLISGMHMGAQDSAPTRTDDAPVVHSSLQNLLDQANQYLSRAEYERALQQADALLEQARARGDSMGQAYAYRVRAMAYQALRQWDSALQEWTRATPLWRTVGETPYLVEALLGEAWVLLSMDSPRWEQAVRQALAAVPTEAPRPRLLANILRAYAQRFREAQQLDIACALYEREVSVRRSVVPNTLEEATALIAVGDIYYEWSDIRRALAAYQQALTILQTRAPNSPEYTYCTTLLGLIHARAKDYATAQEYLETALQQMERHDLPLQARAAVMISLGDIHRLAGRYAQAEQWLIQGVELCQQHPAIDRGLLGLGYEALAALALMRSQTDQAIRYAELARSLYAQIAPNSLQTAAALGQLTVLYMQKGQLTRAQEYAAEIESLLAQYPSSESPELIPILVALAGMRALQGRYEDAFPYYERARQLALRYGESDSLQMILNTLNLLARLLGRTEQADEYQQQLQALGQSEAVNNWIRIVALTARAQSAVAEGRYKDAVQMAIEAIELETRVAVPYFKEHRLTLLTLLGTAQVRLGDFEGAERAYLEAHKLALEQGSNPLLVAGIKTNLGALYLEQEKLEQGEEFLLAARRLFGETVTLDSVGCHLNLAGLYYRRGRYEQAFQEVEPVMRWMQESQINTLMRVRTAGTLGFIELQRGRLDSAQRYLEEAAQVYDSLQTRSYEGILLNAHRARLYRARQDLARAEQLLREAIQSLEEQRADLIDPELRSLFSERYLDVYTLWAQLRLQRGDAAGAAEALERSRARELGAMMQQRQTLLQTNDEPTRQLLHELEQLRIDQLRIARQLVNLTPNDSEWVRLQQRRNALEHQYTNLIQQLERRSPAYRELLEPQRVTIAQIQRALEPGVVLLYYGVADEELLIVAVSRVRVQGYRQPIRAQELKRLVEQFRAIVSKPPRNRTALERQRLPSLGKQLYRILVLPAAEMLKSARRVLICPSGELGLLPWGALITPNSRPNAPTYWVEQIPVLLVPSAGVYLHARARTPSGETAVVAALDYSNFGLQARAPMRDQRNAFVPLPNAPHEAQMLRARWGRPSVVFLNAEASPEAIRTAAQRARIVHFVCHTQVNNRSPYDSALVLWSPLDGSGLLRAIDVMGQWQLRADLAMLSACDANTGVLRRHEGVYGLARAFLFAGARAVGATLWKIDDAATYRLMEAFYTRYLAGTPKDESLQSAQLTLLRDPQYRDPYFWSGLVLIGDYRNGLGTVRPQGATQRRVPTRQRR